MATRKKAAPAATEDAELADKVKSLTHDMLLAGIGAWSRSRSGAADGGKGLPDFAALVAEGRKAEPTLKTSMQKTWDEWKQQSQAFDARKRFGLDGDKLRSAFDERVGAAISSLGLPTRGELDALKAKLGELLGERAPARKSAARKAPAKKAAAKRAPAKKTPAAKAPARKAPARKAPAKTARAAAAKKAPAAGKAAARGSKAGRP
jgi:poly(hydroxyalkanoate) granule-associated protein